MHLEPDATTILIVEDDRTLGRVLAKVLSIRQTAVSVSNAGLALRLVESRWPQLVLLDLCLRDGTALKLAEAIHTLSPKLPLILLTAFPERKSALPAGINRLVTKSINLSDLRQTVDAELAQGDFGCNRETPAFPTHAAFRQAAMSVDR